MSSSWEEVSSLSDETHEVQFNEEISGDKSSGNTQQQAQGTSKHSISHKFLKRLKTLARRLQIKPKRTMLDTKAHLSLTQENKMLKAEIGARKLWTKWSTTTAVQLRMETGELRAYLQIHNEAMKHLQESSADHQMCAEEIVAWVDTLKAELAELEAEFHPP